MKNNSLWISLTAFCVVASVPAAGIAMMSMMMFDSPGSAQNHSIWALFDTVAALPVSLLIGAGVPWIFRRTRFGIWLFAIPLVNVAAICVAAGLLFHCAGQSCK